jgi:hypothetical protein
MAEGWVKFWARLDADDNEVRELTAFANEKYSHGRWIVTQSSFTDDETT